MARRFNSRRRCSGGWARRCILLCCEPNGRNINLGCGALHVESLRAAVLESGANLGVAFDGDADRAIFVAGNGQIVDGDAVLLIAARALQAAGKLDGGLVVATVMSNLGLERALEREGIRLLRTPVGDKYVLEEMVRAGAVLGGEQSGHVIFRQFATTGDGLLTALRVLEIARNAGAGLDELTAGLEIYPQRLQNVRVRERRALHELADGGARDRSVPAGVRLRGARAGALFGHRTSGPRDGGRSRPGARGRIHRSHRHSHSQRDWSMKCAA